MPSSFPSKNALTCSWYMTASLNQTGSLRSKAMERDLRGIAVEPRRSGGLRRDTPDRAGIECGIQADALGRAMPGQAVAVQQFLHHERAAATQLMEGQLDGRLVRAVGIKVDRDPNHVVA